MPHPRAPASVIAAHSGRRYRITIPVGIYQVGIGQAAAASRIGAAPEFVHHSAPYSASTQWVRIAV